LVDRAELGKPFPDIFLKVAEEMSVVPNECLVIEDTLVGVQAAQKGGLDTYAIFDDNDTHDVETLKFEADFYANDFIQIFEKLTTSLR